MAATLVRVGMAAIVLFGVSEAASAEGTAKPDRPFSPIALSRALSESSPRFAVAPAFRKPALSVTRRRDSVLNGALIGAAAGGIGGSALIVAASGGSDDVGKAMLHVAAAPALGGFAIGAIVDFLR